MFSFPFFIIIHFDTQSTLTVDVDKKPKIAMTDSVDSTKAESNAAVEVQGVHEILCF